MAHERGRSRHEVEEEDEDELDPLVGEGTRELAIGPDADLGVGGLELDGETAGVIGRLHGGFDRELQIDEVPAVDDLCRHGQ